MAGFENHARADDAEQDKGDPVIDRGDVLFKLLAEQVADRGHQRLETAEIQADDQHVLRLQLLHGEPLADRDGEGVH